MGFIRGGFLVIVSTLLFFSLLAGNVFLTLNLSLSHDVLKESVSSNFESILQSFGGETPRDEIKKATEGISLYCENNTDFIFSQSGYTVDIPCETAFKGEDAIINEGIGDIIDGIYYKEYSCDSVIKCVSDGKEPFFLFSKQANDYLKSKFYYFVFISLLLALGMFFLVEKKENFPIVAGLIVIVSSLPFMKIEKLFSFFDFSFFQAVPIILSKSYTVFLIMFSLGVVIAVFGIALKFFNFGSFVLGKIDKKIPKKRKKAS